MSIKNHSCYLTLVCTDYKGIFFTFNNFMAPFYGWGLTASRLEPLRGSSLLFTTKFPEIHEGNCLIQVELF